ncbi:MULTISPECIES: GspH/FimT family protein [unclassified Ensifer]|uniref:GspH/FimT family pseudopilin n=1 Tax=unclassified Ensifer TaxID=2633371 RepID=UPI000709CED0|nr:MULTISPECIES: GspH/FimT family protein [unclassified Ensifer]KQW43184.1 hypothetical protein ASD02_35480 [Ensifer sp. Root1252]KRC67122.1 hypothetical protein ASE32_35710 [Ensifer sp. Root231]KRC93701.1 hypothetical protein ASE47_35565 [Ensifer sp. Root258]
MRQQDAETTDGFSLVEMLVALAIIGLAAAIALPSVSSRKTQTPDRLVTQVAHLAQTARLRAMSSGMPTEVIIDITQNHLRLDPGGENLSLPDHITMAAVVGRDAQTTADIGRIVFFPNGGATGGEITLGETTGRKASLRVHWLTGAVKSINDVR